MQVGDRVERIVDLVRDARGEASGHCQLVAGHQRLLGMAGSGDVAEDHDNAQRVATGVANGRGALCDDLFVVFPIQQQCLLLRLGNAVRRLGSIGKPLHGQSSLFVYCMKDLGQGLFEGLFHLPPGQLLRDRIHKAHAANRVACDDSLADRFKRRQVRLAAFIQLFVGASSVVAATLRKRVRRGADGCW